MRSMTLPFRFLHVLILSGVAAMIGFPAAPLASGAPRGGAVLSHLRPAHPRLIALDDHIRRVRQLAGEHEKVRELLAELRREAGELLAAPPVEFKIVGPRLLSQSRRCLDRVYTLAFLYRLDGDPRYAERARRELRAAAGFPHWNPSHFLDTAEMTHAFAIGYDWLYDVLGEDRAIVHKALIEKGLQPAAEAYRGARYGWWRNSSHNWNQVCNGGVAIGALAVADEKPELAQFLLDQALASLRRPLARLAPDGGWDEGPGYWHYAMRYTVYLLAALETAVGTDAGLSDAGGLAETGMFRIHATGPTGRTFNFADGSDRLGSAPLMYWLARKFDRPLYAWHQRATGREAHPHDLIWFDPRGRGPKAEGTALDAWFRGIDVAFFRSNWEDRDALYLAFKGGDNQANHSHLDLGSFVLEAGGHRWAVDLGADNYNLPGYFGQKRWTYYRLRTESHNTLLINGTNQDPSARAPIVAFASTPQRAYAVADLTAAYRPHVASARRGVAMLSRAHVLIQDEIQADQPVDVLWGMVTPANIRRHEQQAILSIDQTKLHVALLEPAQGVFDVVSANPPEPQRQQPGMRKLVVRIPDPAPKVRIAVLLTPTTESSKPLAAFRPELTPLEDWIRQAPK